MKLDLYKQAAKLIKYADGTSSQATFYSDPGNIGLIMYPRGVIDRTADFNPGSDYARNISLLMQQEYSDGNDKIRSGNVSGEWKDISADPYIDVPLKEPSDRLNNEFKQHIGADFNDPRIQRLGAEPTIYAFSTDIPTSQYWSTVNYNPEQISASTDLDAIKILAHENAHLNSRKNLNPAADDWWYGDYQGGYGDSMRSALGLPWEGAFNVEWPAVVNEWTYGQPVGTIHPVMRNGWGGSKPLRAFTSGHYTTDAYLGNMFPLVRTRQLKSEPGREYRYWHAPGEPDKPSGSMKRIVYDTPSGWWVSPSGEWERTGGDVFDPKYYFKNNMNIAYLPPNLQRHIHNMSFLNQGQPTAVRNMGAESLRQQIQDLFAPLALRRKFRHSGDKTYGQLISDTARALDDIKQKSSEDSKVVADTFWSDAIKKNLLGRKYMTVNGHAPYDINAWLEENPMWNPNRTLQPIPIGLAELQKKYSLSPGLDTASDWRDARQYKAIIRDAQHCYDLQNELDTYGPKDGGMGS